MPPPCQGRIFDVFLLAVDYLTRLVDAIDFRLQQFEFHERDTRYEGRYARERKIEPP
jgi:hypothetical protein